MVDSDNSTSLRSVSRRALLAGAISTPLVSAPALRPKPEDDPLLSLWQDWQNASAEAHALNKQVCSLEHAISRTIGYPRVLIPVPTPTSAIWASSHEYIDSKLQDIPDSEDLQRRLHADLAAQQERWNAAEEKVGFQAANHQEILAWKRSEEIATAIFALPANNILGVIAKLILILRTGQTKAEDEEHPWPQLRSILADLRQLASQQASRS